MGKHTKIWLCIAAALLVVGLGLLFGVVLTLQGDMAHLETAPYETHRHALQGAVEEIRILADTADITLVAAPAGTGTVTCCERAGEIHTVTLADGILTVQLQDTRAWYERVGIFFGTPSITVALPVGEYGALHIQGSTGDITLPEGFTFAAIEATLRTGDITCHADAAGAMTLRTDTGRIRVQGSRAAALALHTDTGDVEAGGVTCSGAVTLQVRTGRAALGPMTCHSLTSTGTTGRLTLQQVIAVASLDLTRTTGDIALTQCDAAALQAHTDTGDVTLARCDADAVQIGTDTGDVTGSLRREMTFLTQTDTGRVQVPAPGGTGTCRITTDTGDIRMRIEP